MPASPTPSPDDVALAAALRMIRRRRGLRAEDVAKAMGLKLRTYQHFEAGQSPWNPDRLRRFALATDSDPMAILVAAVLQAPGLALHAMDNKLVSLLMAGLRRFDERLGDDLARIEVGRLIAAFRGVFAALEAGLAERDALTEQWLGDPDPADRPTPRDEPSD